jgi:hypothetical protein
MLHALDERQVFARDKMALLRVWQLHKLNGMAASCNFVVSRIPRKIRRDIDCLPARVVCYDRAVDCAIDSCICPEGFSCIQGDVPAYESQAVLIL